MGRARGEKHCHLGLLCKESRHEDRGQTVVLLLESLELRLVQMDGVIDRLRIVLPCAGPHDLVHLVLQPLMLDGA